MPPFRYLRVHPSFLPHSSNSQIALSFNSLAPFFHYSISTDLPYFSSNFFIPLAPHFFTLHFLSRAPCQSKSLTSFAKLSQPSSFSFSHFHSHILTPPPPILFSLSIFTILTRPLPVVPLGAKAKRVSN